MSNLKKLYVIAMDDEAKDILTEYKLIEEKPFELYESNNNMLVITKVGKTNAASALSYAIAKYNIDIIINLGFVGASSEHNIGDILIVEKALYHDFDATIFGYEKGQVPGLPAHYTSDYNLVTKLNYQKTTLYTGDYFMTDKLNGSYIVDMEGTALFQVAYINKIPIISIKVVSDIIGEESHIEKYNEFEKNGSKYVFKVYKETINVF